MRSFAAVGIISGALMLAAAPGAAHAQRAAPRLSYGAMRGVQAMPSAGQHMGGAWRGGVMSGGHWSGGRGAGGSWAGNRGGWHWNGNSGAHWTGNAGWRGNGGGNWHGNIGGSRWTGRTWNPGHHWTGSWRGYRRPFVGFVVPPFWLGSSYSIFDYGAYGLPAPPYGYNWSRYYDDAVLIGRDGRVADYVSPEDWEEAGAYADDYDYSHDVPPRGIDYFDGDDQVVYHGTWRGTWTGSYEGGPVTSYHGEFRSDDRGPSTAPLPPGAYEAPRLDYGPAVWSGGYVAGGYYYPAPTITTVTVQTAPVVTTTTSFVEESYTPRVARAKARVRWHPKPRPRPRCFCR